MRRMLLSALALQLLISVFHLPSSRATLATCTSLSPARRASACLKYVPGKSKTDVGAENAVRDSDQPGIWRHPLCFFFPPLASARSLTGAFAGLRLRQRPQTTALCRARHQCPPVSNILSLLNARHTVGCFGAVGIGHTRALDVARSGKFADYSESSMDASALESEGAEQAEPMMNWTAALDARGSPLRIEPVNGARPYQDNDEDVDLEVEADEEFEYGTWTSRLPSFLQKSREPELPDVCQTEITSWRDGEMESELGRLEMAVSEDLTPSLLQMNKAMHLCCKAVYKGLGRAGLAKGLRVLTLMDECGVVPNSRTFDLLLDACIGVCLHCTLRRLCHAPPPAPRVFLRVFHAAPMQRVLPVPARPVPRASWF
jgi:hypothetical protein